MSTEWYYRVNGEEVGPIAPTDLKQLANDGLLCPDTQVRRGCDTAWSAARQVRGLFSETAVAPIVAQSSDNRAGESVAEREIAGWVAANNARNGMKPTTTPDESGDGGAITPNAELLNVPHLDVEDPGKMPSTVTQTDMGVRTFFDKYRDDYNEALRVIDNDVGELIKQGKEMKSLFLLGENAAKIHEIHEALASFYTIVFKGTATLHRFGSERLRQLGHDPLPIRAALEGEGLNAEEMESFVLRTFHAQGIFKKHWWIREVFVAEIEYMLDALQILVEPEFVPLDRVAPSTEDTDRYIPSAVKLAVWRRDQGKCVQCGTKEKLEYDHILPVSRGGANTERNVQLLCEKCNREKAARIA
jgi:hypothetical protein